MGSPLLYLVVPAAVAVITALCGLINWWLWLRFAERMAKLHGLAAVRSLPPVARAFKDRTALPASAVTPSVDHQEDP